MVSSRTQGGSVGCGRPKLGPPYHDTSSIVEVLVKFHYFIQFMGPNKSQRVKQTWTEQQDELLLSVFFLQVNGINVERCTHKEVVSMFIVFNIKISTVSVLRWVRISIRTSNQTCLRMKTGTHKHNFSNMYCDFIYFLICYSTAYCLCLHLTFILIRIMRLHSY